MDGRLTTRQGGDSYPRPAYSFAIKSYTLGGGGTCVRLCDRSNLTHLGRTPVLFMCVRLCDQSGWQRWGEVGKCVRFGVNSGGHDTISAGGAAPRFVGVHKGIRFGVIVEEVKVWSTN